MIVNLYFINRSQMFVYIYHMHAKRSHVYMHDKLNDPVQCCPCQSLVDSGNIKTAGHALKCHPSKCQTLYRRRIIKSLFCLHYSVRLYCGIFSLRQFKSRLYSVCTAEADNLFAPKLFAALSQGDDQPAFTSNFLSASSARQPSDQCLCQLLP